MGPCRQQQTRGQMPLARSSLRSARAAPPLAAAGAHIRRACGCRARLTRRAPGRTLRTATRRPALRTARAGRARRARPPSAATPRAVAARATRRAAACGTTCARAPRARRRQRRRRRPRSPTRARWAAPQVPRGGGGYGGRPVSAPCGRWDRGSVRPGAVGSERPAARSLSGTAPRPPCLQARAAPAPAPRPPGARRPTPRRGERGGGERAAAAAGDPERHGPAGEHARRRRGWPGGCRRGFRDSCPGGPGASAGGPGLAATRVPLRCRSEALQGVVAADAGSVRCFRPWVCPLLHSPVQGRRLGSRRLHRSAMVRAANVPGCLATPASPRRGGPPASRPPARCAGGRARRGGRGVRSGHAAAPVRPRGRPRAPWRAERRADRVAVLAQPAPRGGRRRRRRR